MHVIDRKRLRQAEKEHHRDLAGPLGTWFKVARKARWKSIEEVRKTYPKTDPVGSYTVFNIKGNSYRLIAKIEYGKGMISIKSVLTHAEYDEGTGNDWSGQEAI